MKKLLLSTVCGLFLVTSLTGCHTVKGAGEDVSNAGQGIQHAAQ